MKFLAIRSITKLSAALAFISLMTPFVWMEIGPLGYIEYGPTVPDIYILGGIILGKDIRFWGISFAIVFQLIFILYFIRNCFGVLANYEKDKALVFNSINSLLLLLFPYWLNCYIDGVVCNSDGADLTIHWHAGLIIYGILVFLNILALVKILHQMKKNKG